MKAEKYNLFNGIFFLIIGVLEVIFTVEDFSVTQLAFTLAVIMCGFLNIELYKIKDAKRSKHDEN